MRLRALTGWAATVLLGTLGCGQTSGTNDTGSGAGGGDFEPEPGVGAMSLDYVRSGTRVVALGYSSNEARVFRTFHDQKLGIDCNFVPSADGQDQRCVPNQQLPLIFTDADCKEPAGWVEPWGDAAGTAVGDAVSGRSNPRWRDGCPGELPEHVAAFRVGEKLSDEAIATYPLAVYEVRDDECVPAQAPGKIVPATYRLVPIPDSQLARGRRVSVEVSEGLRTTRLVSDDGAELSLGVTGADGVPCAIQRDGECVPEPVARLQSLNTEGRASAALNSDCSTPAFTLPYVAACGTAKFGIEDDGVGSLKVRTLDALTRYFTLDMVIPVTDPLSFECKARPIDDIYRAWAPGRDVTGTLPVATKLRRGRGPLHVDWYAVGQQELLPVYLGHESASPGVPRGEFRNAADEACTVFPAPDGSLHCATLNPQNGQPSADVSSFPEVVAFTY